MDHFLQAKSAIESVFELGQVARRMGRADGAERARDGALDVAKDGVDPLEDAQALGSVDAASDDGCVRALGVGDAGKAGEPVGDDMAARNQAGLGILSDRRLREALDQAQMDTGRPALTGLDRGHEREFVFE